MESVSATKGKSIRHLLAIGPLPPPPSGANVSFQLFCDHLTSCTHIETLSLIDSSPKRIKGNIRIFSIGNLKQAVRQLWLLWQKGPGADTILIFGSNQYLLSLAPLLVLSVRLMGKPCFVRSFGGSLDQFAEKLPSFAQSLLHWGFRQSNGLMVETELLYRHFTAVPGIKTHFVTAYRPIPDSTPNPRPASDDTTLRLLFVSWVRDEKGTTTLLQALRHLSAEEQARIQCDIYGPIVDEYARVFAAELVQTSCASYQGVLANADVLEKMGGYDALVFPTDYQGEGYPGIIVEAMIAGLPVITTQFRSIPDMVDDGINGLLVPPRDPLALAAAIRSLRADPEKMKMMGQENYQRQSQYDLRTVLPQMVAIMES